MRIGSVIAAAVFLLPSMVHAAGQTDYVLVSDTASERTHQFEQFGSRLERCGGVIGLRNEHYLSRVTPAIASEPKNLALNITMNGFPRPSASSIAAGYNLWGPLDGADGTWTNASSDAESSTWDLDFGKPTPVGKVLVKTWAAYPLSDFDLLRWDESLKDWDTQHPVARIRRNKGVLVTIPHLQLTTSKLRMLCLNGPDHQAIFRRIQEFEVYAPPAPPKHFAPRWISYRMKVPTSGKWTLEVQEVNDDRRNGDRSRYRILVDGKSVYLRDFVDDGPGLMTYFVDIPASGKPYATVTLKDTSGFGMCIRSLRAYSDFETYCRENRYMVPMVICPRLPTYDANKGINTSLIDRWTDVFTREGAKGNIGFAVDFAYLQRGPDYCRKLADELGKLTIEKNVPLVLGYPTTWSFSPLNTSDGYGGTFRDIRYQQIGYSKFDNYDDPGLKEYMDSCKPGWYNIHYGLTIPNHWSSTPWLTMNNKILNDARTKGIAQCMEYLNPWFAEMERKGMSGNLLGIIGEDEPVYWTKFVDVFEDGYGRVNNGVPREDLLLDFNWSVIQDAAKDGVKLDPTDGLDKTEKAWLHRNLTKYNLMISTAIRKHIRKEAIVVRGESMDFPKDDRGASQYVYWTGGKGYPLDDRFHPQWESTVFPGSGVGLGMNVACYLRGRELGRVANSDFESQSNKKTQDWIPILTGFYKYGVRFAHHTNPGDPENWTPVARFMAHPTPEMHRRRMESLLIIWRRDALNLIEEMKGTTGPGAEFLKQAQKLLDDGRYRNAYEEAVKAKSVALPANYRIEGEGKLWPYPIRVSAPGSSVEVTVLGIGKQLCIRTVSAAPCTLSINGFSPDTSIILRSTDGGEGKVIAADATGKVTLHVPEGAYTVEWGR